MPRDFGRQASGDALIVTEMPDKCRSPVTVAATCVRNRTVVRDEVSGVSVGREGMAPGALVVSGGGEVVPGFFFMRGRRQVSARVCPRRKKCEGAPVNVTF